MREYLLTAARRAARLPAEPVAGRLRAAYSARPRCRAGLVVAQNRVNLIRQAVPCS